MLLLLLHFNKTLSLLNWQNPHVPVPADTGAGRENETRQDPRKARGLPGQQKRQSGRSNCTREVTTGPVDRELAGTGCPATPWLHTRSSSLSTGRPYGHRAHSWQGKEPAGR